MDTFRRLSLLVDSPSLNVYVALDNMIVINDIKRGSSSSGDTGESEGSVGKWTKPLLLFIPLRLGLTELNPIYFTDLKVGDFTAVMKTKTFVAIRKIVLGAPLNILHFLFGFITRLGMVK